MNRLDEAIKACLECPGEETPYTPIQFFSEQIAREGYGSGDGSTRSRRIEALLYKASVIPAPDGSGAPPTLELARLVQKHSGRPDILEYIAQGTKWCIRLRQMNRPPNGKTEDEMIEALEVLAKGLKKLKAGDSSKHELRELRDLIDAAIALEE